MGIASGPGHHLCYQSYDSSFRIRPWFDMMASSKCWVVDSVVWSHQQQTYWLDWIILQLLFYECYYGELMRFSIIKSHWPNMDVERCRGHKPIHLFMIGWLVSLQPWQFTLLMLRPGPRFSIKMPSYQYRKSHCGDKTVVRSSYLHNGISFTGKTTSFYWIGAPNIPGKQSLYHGCW